MGMLASGFLSPGLLGWLALAAVPVVIHLLTRRRVVRLAWAAMKFLERAHRKTRRRIQLENLLLLVLRVLAIALLVAAAARPFLQATSPLAELAHTPRHVAVIVDVSASMGYDDGTGPLLDRARRGAEKILAGLKPAAGDTAVLIPHAAPADPREDGAAAAAYLDPERLRATLSGLAVTDRTSNLADAFETARRALERHRTGQEIYLVSDLQKVGFGGAAAGREEEEEGGAGAALSPAGRYQGVRDALQRAVAAGATLHVVDVGPEAVRPENVGLVAFTRPPRVVTVAQPAVMEARVRNFGTEPREVAVQFYVDHDASPRGVARPQRIPPGGEASFLFFHAFQHEGPVAVRAVLKPLDSFTHDDERLLVVPVEPRVKVLLVEGSSRGTEAFESAAFFLLQALDPFGADGDLKSAFAPEAIAWHELARADLAAYGIVVLADCPVPSETETATLAAFVAAGGGLLVTWGPNTDPELARERLASATGLLPVVPERVVGQPDYTDPRHRQYRLRLGARHPATRPFHADADLETWLEDGVAVGRFLRSVPVRNAAEPVRVLLEFDDEERSPALAERRVGAGKVMLLATTAHTRWTNLPVDRQAPLFLMLVDGIANHLRVAEPDPFNLRVGDPLLRIYSAFPGKRELKRPSGAGEVLTPVRLGAGGEAAGGDEDGGPGASWRFLLRKDRLMERGVHRLIREAPRLAPGPAEELFAVNPDPVESALERFGIADLQADVFQGIPFEVPALDGLEKAGVEGPRGGELWKYLVLGALACLVAEMIAAQRIGARQT
ncbi:MAG: BatA and WFA domain-containing protein [Planctomycetes bacterium]|nr:BatA and WFA domain-containing protein [Planctomycetota bacterium]